MTYACVAGAAFGAAFLGAALGLPADSPNDRWSVYLTFHLW